MSVSLFPVFLSVYLFTCSVLLMCLPIGLSTCSVYPSLHPVYLLSCRSCLSHYFSPSTCLPTCRPVCLSVYLSVWSIRPSTCFSVPMSHSPALSLVFSQSQKDLRETSENCKKEIKRVTLACTRPFTPTCTHLHAPSGLHQTCGSAITCKGETKTIYRKKKPEFNRKLASHPPCRRRSFVWRRAGRCQWKPCY